MKSFNVLNASQSITQNWLLEASAGSGKTFSIENLFVRLLLENEETTVEKILVVTFTRAAVSDLKVRIKANLKKYLTMIKENDPSMPDFLVGHTKAQELITRALYRFDDAQIFTIHSFCSRMLGQRLLEADIAISQTEEDALLSKEEKTQIILDFFRTGIGPSQFTQAELKVVLENHQHSLEVLTSEIEELISKGIDLEPGAALEQRLKLFSAAMGDLKKMHNLSKESILQDFELLVPHFNKIVVNRKVKPEINEKILRFAALFEMDQWGVREYDTLLEDQLIWVLAFDPMNIAKKGAPPQHHLREKLIEILQPLFVPHLIFARMAAACQILLKKRMHAQEKYGYDELLHRMNDALNSEVFQKSTQESYRAALVDEFQDTDPVQWEIFRKLFTSESGFNGYFYLVGDPKQSIYAFRQADIYTYLAAATHFNDHEKAGLNTNWRSRESLVHALNTLFSTENCPNLFSLPSVKNGVTYPMAMPSQGKKEQSFSAVHFSFYHSEKGYPLEECESAAFFPFMCKEIIQLHKQGVSFKEMAVLVADRYQTGRVKKALSASGIPCKPQRGYPLTETAAYHSLCAILEAILHPKDESRLKIALASPLINCPFNELIEQNLHAMQLVSKLYAIWHSSGFSHLARALMQADWIKDTPFSAHILSQAEGEEHYRQLLQLQDKLLEQAMTPEKLLLYLYNLSREKPEEACDPSQDAVNILTIHSSKGLEYEIVFTLGLLKRTSKPPLFVPKQNRLVPVASDEDAAYLNYCEEIDAEKMRQLYVAMTRAKDRVYCQVILSKEKELKPGRAAPIELYLARLGQPPASSKELYLRIQNGIEQPALSFLEKQKCEEITVSILNKEEEPVVPLEAPPLKPISFKAPVLKEYPQIRIDSFSGLTAQNKHTLSYSPPTDFDATEKTPQTLPAGPETGTLLHEILEKIPNQIPKKEIPDFLDDFLLNTRFFNWKEAIAKVIEHALFHPYFDGFSLADVSPDCMRPELEFLYPDGKNHYLKGFIDLLFEHKGKIYLVDWKSNWLPDYQQSTLDAAIRFHQYDLQAKIYSEAIQRYFRLFDKQQFAGSYYIFLRGEKNGSFHLP
ncbi:MAG: UvrD-helicase domain-containing protein [Waddliaceae bacterium]